VGQSFTDPEAGVTITRESVSRTGAAVTVRFGGAGSVSTATVTVSTDQPSYALNQTVSIKASVRSGPHHSPTPL
jgi:hypothetical protein